MESNLNGQANEESQFSAIHEIEKILLGKEEPKKATSEPRQENSAAEEEDIEEQTELEELDAEQDDGDGEDEEKEDEPKYKVKIGGEEKEIPISELLNGYQRQSDYTKKTMELAEQRKALEAEAQKNNELAKTREKYLQQLDLVETLLSRGRTEQELLQINEEQGAEAYIRARAEEDQRIANLNKLKGEKERVNNEIIAQYQEATRQARAKAIEELPELKDKDSYKKFEDFVLEMGFSKEDLDTTSDPRVLKIALMAMKAANIEKARKDLKDKKAKTPNPPMQKPVSRVTNDQLNREDYAKKHAQLRKTGSLEDAAAVFAKLL